MTNLILTPTERERQIIEPMISGTIEVCGFGLIAAAACSAQSIAKHDPSRVFLLGIAGSLSDACQIGSAYEFGSIRCEGIGVGCGEDHLSAGELGWNHFGDIGDSISLDSASSLRLRSVCAASASPSEAIRRGDADAEEMEGFAVAMACQLFDKPLTILRGISNQAGDRDHSNWQIEKALQATAALFLETWGA